MQARGNQQFGDPGSLAGGFFSLQRSLVFRCWVPESSSHLRPFVRASKCLPASPNCGAAAVLPVLCLLVHARFYSRWFDFRFQRKRKRSSAQSPNGPGGNFQRPDFILRRSVAMDTKLGVYGAARKADGACGRPERIFRIASCCDSVRLDGVT